MLTFGSRPAFLSGGARPARPRPADTRGAARTTLTGRVRASSIGGTTGEDVRSVWVLAPRVVADTPWEESLAPAEPDSGITEGTAAKG